MSKYTEKYRELRRLKPPIPAMAKLYRERPVDFEERSRWLSECRELDEGLQAGQDTKMVGIPKLPDPQPDLSGFEDRNLPVVFEDVVDYLWDDCRVCGRRFVWMDGIREGCSPVCRYEVATRRYGSDHWLDPGTTRSRAYYPRVRVSSLPDWQKKFCKKGRYYEPETRLIYGLSIGRPLREDERVRLRGNRVALANINLIEPVVTYPWIPNQRLARLRAAREAQTVPVGP